MKRSEHLPQEGVRSKRNAEKRRRIREAARDIFCRRGYVDATTREICEKSGVGNGTLFRHASDKRELLLLIVNDDLASLHIDTGKRILAAKTRRPLRERILQFYRVRYDYFAKYPEISRPYVKEAFNFMGVKEKDVGPEARQQLLRRHAVVAEVEKIIADDARTRKAAGADTQLIADLIHAIYLSASREWAESTKLDVAVGMRRLSVLLDLAAVGFREDWRE